MPERRLKKMQFFRIFLPVMYMNIHIRLPEKQVIAGKSTLLVGKSLYSYFSGKNRIKGLSIRKYFHFLLNDPDLEYKLSFLVPKKWKKHYQDEGQDLQVIRFIPIEEDWARISIFSNATGFSRCFIFIYLMKIDLGLIELPEKEVTIPKILSIVADERTHCSILMDERTQKLERKLGIRLRW
jgi:hypothetical protein